MCGYWLSISSRWRHVSSPCSIHHKLIRSNCRSPMSKGSRNNGAQAEFTPFSFWLSDSRNEALLFQDVSRYRSGRLPRKQSEATKSIRASWPRMSLEQNIRLGDHIFFRRHKVAREDCSRTIFVRKSPVSAIEEDVRTLFEESGFQV